MVPTDFFPYETFRVGQREAIEAIAKAFESGYKYVTYNGPTGSGKSVIAVTLTRYFEKKYGQQSNILTIQKILQDQYTNDFDDLFALKGRAGYLCNHIQATPGDTCYAGPCRRKKENNPDCPYQIARSVAAVHSRVVHNFHSYYYSTMGSLWSMKKRGFMVIDEAHNIENTCLDFMSFTISNSKRPFVIPEFHSIEDYEVLINVEAENARKELAQIEALSALSKEQLKDQEELQRFVKKVNKYFATKDEIQYVFEYTNEKNYQKVEFKPVLVGDFVKDNILKGPEKVLMMSATILNKEQFCYGIGLDPSKVCHVNSPSTFPADNRPIVKQYVGSMSYKNIRTTLPAMVEFIGDLLNRYPNTKGIIHTVSEANATFIKHNLFMPRLTHRRDFSTVNEMLLEHQEKHASIIVASGLREGLDLDEDLGRLQILMKVPYPSMGDKRVKVRMKLDHNWYGYITSESFVQTYGRCIRSETDTAHTYLLDKDFGRFFGMNKRFIPEYVMEAVHG